MEKEYCRVYLLIVEGKVVKSFATLVFLENYCKKNGIVHYGVREEVTTQEEGNHGC